MYCIHAKSPGLSGSLSDTAPTVYGTDLPLSRTGHQVSRMKSSLDLFCALVWDAAHFLLKMWIFLIRSMMIHDDDVVTCWCSHLL